MKGWEKRIRRLMLMQWILKKKNVNVNEVYDVVKIRKIRKMKVGVKCWIMECVKGEVKNGNHSHNSNNIDRCNKTMQHTEPTNRAKYRTFHTGDAERTQTHIVMYPPYHTDWSLMTMEIGNETMGAVPWIGLDPAASRCVRQFQKLRE